MIYFSTLYCIKDTKYSSFIYAANRSSADAILKSRNIGEEIIGELIPSKDFNPSPLPSDFYLERQLTSCIHTLTFYGWLASRAGVVPFINDVLMRDDGILHEVLHEMHFPKEYPYRDHVFKALLDFESEIPGLSSWHGKKVWFERGADRRQAAEAS